MENHIFSIKSGTTKSHPGKNCSQEKTATQKFQNDKSCHSNRLQKLSQGPVKTAFLHPKKIKQNI